MSARNARAAKRNILKSTPSPQKNSFALLSNSMDDEDESTPTRTTEETVSTLSSSKASPNSSLRGSGSPRTNLKVSFSEVKHAKRKACSFLKVRLQVKAHNEGATGVSNALGKLLSIAREVDESVLLAIYAGDMDNPEKGALDAVAGLPTSITALKKYAYRVKPQKQGGTTWTNIKILHNVDIHEILQDTKDEFREEQFGLYLQPIQHHKVVTIGWIMFLHEEVDLQFWQVFF